MSKHATNIWNAYQSRSVQHLCNGFHQFHFQGRIHSLRDDLREAVASCALDNHRMIRGTTFASHEPEYHPDESIVGNEGNVDPGDVLADGVEAGNGDVRRRRKRWKQGLVSGLQFCTSGSSHGFIVIIIAKNLLLVF